MIMQGNIVELEKPYFGIDKNFRVTYNKDEIVEHDDFFLTEYATLLNVMEMLSLGYTVFVYLNPDSKDGLWNRVISNSDVMGTKSGIPKKYDYRVFCLNIENIIID